MEETQSSSAASVAASQKLSAPVPETPNKMRKRRKLRRLVEVKRDEQQQGSQSIRQTVKRFLIGSLLIALAIAVLLGHLLRQNAGNTQVLRDFMSSYRKQYNQIVHGTLDYCDQPLDTQALFTNIRQRGILHQDRALLQLQLAMRNNSRFTAIAAVGPPGVGKSLWARALEQNFPWRENVHSYAWNTFVRDEDEKFAVIQLFADRLSDCGHNLLVIENLSRRDQQVVPILNELLMEATESETNGMKRLIVVYIFSLNTYENPEEYNRQLQQLQDMENTTTINFQALGKDELRDCIRREARLEHLTLSDSDFEQVVASIDPVRSGCKNVYAKVLMYGKSQVLL